MDQWPTLDALGQRMMTHEAEQPNPALPILNAMRELNPFGGRGISGMIGYRDRFGGIIQNPDNVAAMGSLGPAKLFHGSPISNLGELRPSIRGPLGPGAYTSPAPQIAESYAGEGGTMYTLPERNRDIYFGHGHRTDAEWFGFKRDRQRLIEAAEPDKKEAVKGILDRLGSNDGYPAYQRLLRLYGSEDATQGLFKKAGFEGVSGLVDGPEVLLFGQQSLSK